jgi:hypothetical protein
VTFLNWLFLVAPSFGTLTLRDSFSHSWSARIQVEKESRKPEPARSLAGRETGVSMEDPVLDEAFMRRYRELLDAEDNAFDELEHAYEDGDREHFETDYAAWQSVLGRKLAFLERRGIATESPFASRSA